MWTVFFFILFCLYLLRVCVYNSHCMLFAKKMMINSKHSGTKKIKGKVKFFFIFFFFSFIRLFKKQNEIQVHVHGCQLLKAIFISHTSNSERKKNTRVLPLFNIYFNNTMNLIDIFFLLLLLWNSFRRTSLDILILRWQEWSKISAYSLCLIGWEI